MSGKPETATKAPNTTTTNTDSNFKPGLTLPPELKNISIDYNKFGTFNTLPKLTSKNEPK